MNFRQLEEVFSKAWVHSFSKTKLLLTFLVLAFCGLSVVFSRIVSLNVCPWVSMCFIFLPFFVSSSILLALGILLTKMYLLDKQGKKYRLSEIFLSSIPQILKASYIVVPLFLSYLFLWVILGFFFLLKDIPVIGEFLGVVLIFAPYLLILASLFMAGLNIVILFFVTPVIALRSTGEKIHTILIDQFKNQPFKNLFFLVIAFVPLGTALLFLILSAYLTGHSYLKVDSSLIIGLKWFFIMLPFALFTTPVVNFFFNFSSEAHFILKTKQEIY